MTKGYDDDRVMKGIRLVPRHYECAVCGEPFTLRIDAVTHRDAEHPVVLDCGCLNHHHCHAPGCERGIAPYRTYCKACRARGYRAAPRPRPPKHEVSPEVEELHERARELRLKIPGYS